MFWRDSQSNIRCSWPFSQDNIALYLVGGLIEELNYVRGLPIVFASCHLAPKFRNPGLDLVSWTGDGKQANQFWIASPEASWCQGPNCREAPGRPSVSLRGFILLREVMAMVELGNPRGIWDHPRDGHD